MAESILHVPEGVMGQQSCSSASGRPHLAPWPAGPTARPASASQAALTHRGTCGASLAQLLAHLTHRLLPEPLYEIPSPRNNIHLLFFFFFLSWQGSFFMFLGL